MTYNFIDYMCSYILIYVLFRSHHPMHFDCGRNYIYNIGRGSSVSKKVRTTHNKWNVISIISYTNIMLYILLQEVQWNVQ